METPVPNPYMPLKGKTILLGVTGSSAIYKSVDLARELIRRGARVKVLMTSEAISFVSPKLFEWATGEKVVVGFNGEAVHVKLATEADSMVIAPATLNTMSKLAYGVGDNPLVLTGMVMLNLRKPVVVVPTMNIRLYNTPQLKRVSKVLEEMGVIVVPPYISEDKAKYPPIRDLASIIDGITVRNQDLRGLRILVTAGPTREYIDPVRVITNPSSGLMGVLLALEFYSRGAQVTLIHGPMSVDPPYCTENISVETTNEMASVIEELTTRNSFDVAVFAAAPADYMVEKPAVEKIPSRINRLELVLVPTRKVIKSVKKRPKLMIGFAAETTSDMGRLVEKARSKLVDYGLDLIVANTVGVKTHGFSSRYINACLVSMDRVECIGFVDKSFLARKIADWTADRIGG